MMVFSKHTVGVPVQQPGMHTETSNLQSVHGWQHTSTMFCGGGGGGTAVPTMIGVGMRPGQAQRGTKQQGGDTRLHDRCHGVLHDFKVRFPDRSVYAFRALKSTQKLTPGCQIVSCKSIVDGGSVVEQRETVTGEW